MIPKNSKNREQLEQFGCFLFILNISCRNVKTNSLFKKITKKCIVKQDYMKRGRLRWT